MTDLDTAAQNMERARVAFRARCLEVWQAAATIEPALTSAIRELGWDESAAADWLCSSADDGAPLQRLLAGQHREVLEILRRAASGFYS